MVNILIFGAGAIGSAFSVPCLDRQHQVRIVGTHLEEKFIDELKYKKNFIQHSNVIFQKIQIL